MKYRMYVCCNVVVKRLKKRLVRSLFTAKELVFSVSSVKNIYDQLVTQPVTTNQFEIPHEFDTAADGGIYVIQKLTVEFAI